MYTSLFTYIHIQMLHTYIVDARTVLIFKIKFFFIKELKLFVF